MTWKPIVGHGEHIRSTISQQMRSHLTLGEFACDVANKQSRSSEHIEPLIQAIYHCATKDYGSKIAENVSLELRETRNLLTANHHGFDPFADSVHATLIYSLGQRWCKPSRESVLVLASSGIGLGNSTYPSGLQLYDYPSKQYGTYFRRFRIMSERWRHVTVSSAAPYTSEMLVRLRRALEVSTQAGVIGLPLKDMMLDFMEEALTCPPEIPSL